MKGHHSRDEVLANRASVCPSEKSVLSVVPPDAPEQHTLAAPIALEGVGLHTGAWGRVRVEPLDAGSGLQLVRDDRGSRPIRIRPDRILDTRRATTLGDATPTSGWSVNTVEHLLAALYGCGVDNALIRVDGPEIPLLDGSALPFVQAMEAVGFRAQGQPRPFFYLTSAHAVEEGHRWIRCSSGEGLTLSCHLDFPHPHLRDLRAEVSVADFRSALAGARTFGFQSELEALRQQGLIQGGALTSALVMGEHGWLNPELLRLDHEPARHKLLDLLGDLAVLGVRLQGRIDAFAPGHALTARLTSQLFREINP